MRNKTGIKEREGDEKEGREKLRIRLKSKREGEEMERRETEGVCYD